jgi:hypothetical protein
MYSCLPKESKLRGSTKLIVDGSPARIAKHPVGMASVVMTNSVVVI